MNRTDDKQMIENPNRWPFWPVLPIKRRRALDRPEVAVITPDYPAIVIHVGLYEVDRVKLVIHQLNRGGDVEGARITKYTDVDALLDDGWVVD